MSILATGDYKMDIKDAMEAAVDGDVDPVVAFVEEGRHVDSRYEPWDNDTLLLKACLFNRKDIVEYLLEAGADPNLKNRYGETALHLASTDFAKADVVGMLLKAKADVNAVDNRGWTALHFAAASSNTQIGVYQHLCDAQPDFELVTTVKTTGDGGVPKDSLAIHAALVGGNHEGLKALYPHQGNMRDKKGNSLLIRAAEFKRYSMHNHVEFLVELGEDVNAANNFGWTALHYACLRISVDVKFVELLIQSGADASIKSAKRHKKFEAGTTAWELAKSVGRPADKMDYLEKLLAF
jgi:ankyrin repeat protein